MVRANLVNIRVVGKSNNISTSFASLWHAAQILLLSWNDKWSFLPFEFPPTCLLVLANSLSSRFVSLTEDYSLEVEISKCPVVYLTAIYHLYSLIRMDIDDEFAWWMLSKLQVTMSTPEAQLSMIKLGLFYRFVTFSIRCSLYLVYSIPILSCLRVYRIIENFVLFRSNNLVGYLVKKVL